MTTLPLVARPRTQTPLAPRREVTSEVLAQCRVRDAQAARILVATYQDRVYAVVWRLLRGSHRVPDVAQETFLRVFAKLPRFDERGAAPLSTWILTIATRLCFDELRALERKRTHVDTQAEVVVPQLHGHAVAIDDAVSARADRARIDDAIAHLPDDQRAVLVLRAYAELSTDETARVLGVEEGTVKSRLSRARQTLRDALEPKPNPSLQPTTTEGT